MKKNILSIFTLICFGLPLSAETLMYVQKKDGSVKGYPISEVTQVLFEEDDRLVVDTSDWKVSVSGITGKQCYVDLGLPNGTLWATCNVGAKKPQDFGYFYSWGETLPKSSYSWETYKWSEEDTDYLTKYCLSESKGVVDSLVTLLPEDDAATVNWGSEWRMPTYDEVVELIDGCDWNWVESYMNVKGKGFVGKSKANGNVIFLPAAGYYVESRHECFVDRDRWENGIQGNYWSSTLLPESSDRNLAFFFYSYILDEVNILHSIRYVGNSVRAVVNNK